jgi:Holliday junction resolvase RusA-like endonuclease
VTAILRITIPGPPQAKERPRIDKHGNVYTPDSTRRYEATVRWLALAAMAKQSWSAWSKSECSVTAHVYFGDARRRDLDNCAKACLDALNKLVFVDDSQVRELVVRSWIDAKNPRVELEIRKLDATATA